MTSIDITETETMEKVDKTRGCQNLMRRRFLKAAGAFTILVPGYLSGIEDIFAFEGLGRRSQKILEDLTISKLERYMNTSFWLRPEDSYLVELEIIEINGDDVQFSVMFLCPKAVSFPQDTYWVEHAELGEFDLFLVPLGEDQDGTYYVASFNHMTFRGDQRKKRLL